jgi:hypothetical protein
MPNAVSRDRAIQLMRVGWVVAELRGRALIGTEVDLGRFLPPLPTRVSHALPLDQERSQRERLISIRQVFKSLCADTSLAVSSNGMVDYQGNEPATTDTSGCDRILELANVVPLRHDDPEWQAKWQAFAEALYKYDERMQDLLSAGAFGESSAYQRGRGLAETSWSLDSHAAPNSFTSWTYMLGAQRTLALTSLIDRLTPFAITSDIAQAIKGSLAAWQRLVEKPDWEDDGSAVVRLRQQVELWRDLLLSGADPTAIVPPKATLARMSTIGPLTRLLAPQLVLGSVSTGLLATAAWFLTSHPSSAGPLGAIVAALSVVGVTGSTLSAKAKSSANQTVSRIRTALAADLLVEQATILPDSATTTTSRITVVKPGALAEPVTVASLPSSAARFSPPTANGAHSAETPSPAG